MGRSRTCKALLGLAVTLVMAMGLLLGARATAYAVDPVLYLGANDSEETCSEYTVVEDNVDRVAWSGGWFVVPAEQTVTLSGGLDVTGDVSLILCDGATLVIGSDIRGEVATPGSDDYSLTVYAQSHGDFAGKMVVGAGQEWDRGIRMDHLSIYGGDVTSVAGWHHHGIQTKLLTVDGGDVAASSTGEEHAGIYAANSMYLVRGSVKGTNENHTGIASAGYLIVNGADVEATGGTYGMHAASADFSLDVLSGSVTCQGGTAAIATEGDLSVNEGMMVRAGADQESAAYVEDIASWKHAEKWAHIGPHEHDGKIFQAWGWTDSLPVESGNYVLTDDVTLDETWQIPAGADIHLCLGDKSISLAGADARIVCGDTTDGEARSLTIYDEGEGTITGNPEEDRDEALVSVGTNCTFTLTGGTVTGSTCGGVDVFGGTFEMRGGEICENSSRYGGGVWVGEDAVFDMSGGVIHDNEGPSATGGGVYVGGGMYVGINVGASAGKMRVSGNAKVVDNREAETGRPSNVYLGAGTDEEGGCRPEGDAKILIDDVLLDGARIGVRMEVPGVFTTGWKAHMEGADANDHFTSDDPVYSVEPQGNELALTKEPEPTPTPTGKTMYRLYNPNSGEHFYTSDTFERDHVIAAGWSDEGIGWTAPTEGQPVYRLYNANAGDHHYTISKNERDTLVSVGWKDEGIGWMSDPARGVPIWREYNPYAIAGAHNFTASLNEHVALCGLGWRGEGIAWYGIHILK